MVAARNRDTGRWNQDSSPGPHVYAAVKAGDLSPKGALLSGDSVSIQTAGDITNAGTILGRKVVQIEAGNIHNLAGLIQAQDVTLQATQNINNTGGTVVASNSLVALAGRDLNVSSTTASSTGSSGTYSYSQTGIDRIAGFYVQGKGVLYASAGNNINLTAAEVAGKGAVQLDAGNNVNINTLKTSQTNNFNAGDAKNHLLTSQISDAGSTISAGTNLTVNAGNSINAKAASLSAADTVSLAAKGNIVLDAGQTQSSYDSVQTSSSSGLLSSTTTSTQTQASAATAQVSTLSAKNVSVIADQNLVSVGTEFKGTESLRVEGKDTTTLYAATNTRQSTTTTQSTTTLGGALSAIAGGITLEDKTTTDSAATASSIGTKLISNEKVVIGVGNKTELQGTEVKAPQIAFVKTDPTKAGELILGGSTNTSQTSHTEKTETAGVYQEMKGQGSTTQTLNQTKISGNVSFDNALKITVQIPDTKGGQMLKSQINALVDQSGGTGLEYLNQLAANPNVQWDKVALANEKWSYDQAGLTPAGAALLSIAVAAYMPGASGMFGATTATGTTLGGVALTTTTAAGVTTATFAGAALNAGFTALASQAAVAMVNNKGDIGKTLEQMGSEQSIKSLLTTMVTAGALNALGNSTLFNGQSGTAAAGSNGISTAQTAATFGDKLLKNITNNLAGSAIDAAINGKPFDEKTLTNALASALVTTGMAQGANAIGDAKYNGDINGFTQKVAHAVLGCAGGAATAGNMSGCSAGAVGAVVGELAAEYYMDSHKDNGKTFAENKASALAFAKVMSATAGVIAGGGGNNAAAVNIANTTGANAAENNFLTHAQAKSMKDDMAACKATRCSAEEERVIRDRYIGLSNDNISAVQAMIVAGDAAGVKKLEEQAASSREVSGIFGIRQDEEIFTNRQNNINVHGSVKGKDSLFGSDLQQAQEVARFRKDNCAGISAGACNQLVSQALDDRMKRVGILMAAGAVTPVAVNGIRVLRASGKSTTGSSSASTSKESPTSSRGKPDEMLPDASLANVYANQNGGKPLGKPLGSYDMTNGGGPLPPNLAGTFSGGRYMEIVTTEPVVLYRAGTKDVPLGQFFSTEQPTGVIQTRVDQAVLPVWPGGGKSPLDSVFKVTVPPGTKLYYGEIGAQNSFYVGGTPQIVVQAPWKIPGVKSELIGPLK